MKSEQKVSLFGLSCREASRLISESLDRELTRRERWSLRIHTLMCTACQRFARQVKWIREAIANIPEARREQWSGSAITLSVERRAQMKRLLADALRADSPD